MDEQQTDQVKAPPRRPTLKDVAKAAGVSLASASYAVNKTGSLGEDTRQHILAVADSLGYRQNPSARAIRTGRTGAIGLIIPDLTNPLFPALVHSVVHRARSHGISVFVIDTAGDEDQEIALLEQLIDRRVDGIIWFPVREQLGLPAITGIVPVIILDRYVAGAECIQADYAAGGRLAAQHLLDLGHQSVGIIAGPLDGSSMRERCDAARAAIERQGKLAFIVENAFTADLSADALAAINDRTASAIFCGADVIAIGAIGAAQAAGLRVPVDLSVVGFDDIAWVSHSSPPLTTIDMPVDEMAAEAVELLLRRIDGEVPSSRRIIFPVSLIERASTCPPLLAQAR